MVAYIVGMITGAVCMVMPLIYAMNVNRCVAVIMASNPEFDPAKFVAYTPPGLLYVIAVIGALVLLAGAAMTVMTGYLRLRKQLPTPPAVEPGAKPATEPAPPAAEL